MKKQGFTLIELLVVIVIIGILATVSTALFSGNRSKALVVKYQSQRIQASKEAYGDCMIVSQQHCGPSFVVYRGNDGSLYKKDVMSSSDDIGVRLTNTQSFRPAITADGKSLIYIDASNPYRIYKKDMNSASSNFGSVLMNGSGSFDGLDLSITPDGRFLIYHNNTVMFKKDLNESDTNPGEPFTDIRGIQQAITRDGLFVIYRNRADGSRLYKKSINSASSDPGEPFTDSAGHVPSTTPDGEFIIYVAANGLLYKKGINSPSSDEGTLFTDNGGWDSVVSYDGRYLIYQNRDASGNLYKKDMNSPSSDPGEFFATPHGSGGYLSIFP